MGIISTVTGFASGGMSVVYKWGAIAFVVLAIAVGSGWWGYHRGKDESAKVIAEYKSAVNELSAANHIGEVRVVEKVVTQYVTKVQYIKEKANTNEKIITVYVHDNEFLSDGWLYAHDTAAAGGIIDPALAANGTPSTVTAAQALAGVAGNYAICEKNAAELSGLQQYINERNKVIAENNKKIAR